MWRPGVSRKSFFERKLKFVFRKHFKLSPKNLALYRQALWHKSFAHLKGEVDHNNERLEFLGDALLSAFTADYLYHLFPGEAEGRLTKLRAKIVSRRQLNKLAMKLEVNHLVKAAASTNYTQNSVPGNTLEALIGAIYLDLGYNKLHESLTFIFENHVDVETIEHEERDYKSMLYEWCQSVKKVPVFTVKSEKNEAGKTRFQVQLQVEGESCTGEGSSKRRAERQAAKKFLDNRGIL